MSDRSRTERRLLASIRTAKSGGEGQGRDSAAQPEDPSHGASSAPAGQGRASADTEPTARALREEGPGRQGGRSTDRASKYQSVVRVWPD